MTPPEPLKGCPFCGGKARVRHEPPCYLNIKCDGCGVSGPDGTLATIVAAWNRRAEDGRE